MFDDIREDVKAAYWKLTIAIDTYHFKGISKSHTLSRLCAAKEILESLLCEDEDEAEADV